MTAKTILIAVAAVACAACTLVAAIKVPVRNEGDLLVDVQGMTLYTFDRDPVGASVCNGPCALNWPPLYAAADAESVGHYALVVRDDGRKQWMYRGKPLYLWSKDQKPGERTGHGVNNMWRTARP